MNALTQIARPVAEVSSLPSFCFSLNKPLSRVGIAKGKYLSVDCTYVKPKATTGVSSQITGTMQQKHLMDPGSVEKRASESHGGIGILRFLHGKSFLVTGAAGFLAKVLVEKILSSSPGVCKIYLLIQARNQKAAMLRMINEIINTELFNRLRVVHGKYYRAFMLSKLIPVVGNITSENLGIEVDMANEMAENVDVIVNSAATTTFDERIDAALDVNTKGPCRLISFAKAFKQLKLFLHVSTAYVNGQREGVIIEKAFSMGDTIASEKAAVAGASYPTLDVETEISTALAARSASEESNVAQHMRCMGRHRAMTYGWRDTYGFTKAMGEMLINSTRDEIPVVIVRPTVIESTLRDPFPGWIEGNRMMDPIILHYGKGHLTGFPADSNGVLDVVPADMVVNAMLAAMAKNGQDMQPKINIYHISSSDRNPLYIQHLVHLVFEHFTYDPFVDSRGKRIRVSEMKLCHTMDEFASHIEENAKARLSTISSEQHCRRLETAFKRSMEHAKHLASIYQAYTFYGARFDDTNTRQLLNEMSLEETRNFFFDTQSINWRNYICNVHIPGLRKHVMKGRRIIT